MSIPDPIPTNICVNIAAKCASKEITLFFSIWFSMSNSMNGISTIIGVFSMPSIFRNSNILLLLLLNIMNIDAGSVPDIIDANINA